LTKIFDYLKWAAQRLREEQGEPPSWEEHPFEMHIVLYLVDELKPEGREKLEAHVKSCGECRWKLDLMASSQRKEKDT
jgi:hypothetical protein